MHTATNQATALYRDHRRSASRAQLHHVRCGQQGITRVGKGSRSRYVKAGRIVRDPVTLDRIRALAIPPAWTQVWICADPQGHLQATGVDAKGRKQYRYHALWSRARGQVKFDHVLGFATRLPALRAQMQRDLARPGLPMEKVLATVLGVMEHTTIRIGQESYARDNGSYGLSTMKDRHLQGSSTAVRFVFRGKTGILHKIRLNSRRLSRIVMRCKALPGQDLFQYIGDDGAPHPITSGQVNSYLQQLTDAAYTTKDIRTWKGTLLAFQALLASPPPRNASHAQRMVNRALDEVAHELGNTRAVCRKHYVHPAVIETYVADRLAPAVKGRRGRAFLDRDEVALLHLLQRGRKGPARHG